MRIIALLTAAAIVVAGGSLSAYAQTDILEPVAPPTEKKEAPPAVTAAPPTPPPAASTAATDTAKPPAATTASPPAPVTTEVSLDARVGKLEKQLADVENSTKSEFEKTNAAVSRTTRGLESHKEKIELIGPAVLELQKRFGELSKKVDATGDVNTRLTTVEKAASENAMQLRTVGIWQEEILEKLGLKNDEVADAKDKPEDVETKPASTAETTTAKPDGEKEINLADVYKTW